MDWIDYVKDTIGVLLGLGALWKLGVNYMQNSRMVLNLDFGLAVAVR